MGKKATILTDQGAQPTDPSNGSTVRARNRLTRGPSERQNRPLVGYYFTGGVKGRIRVKHQQVKQAVFQVITGCLVLATIGCGAKQVEQPPTEANLKVIYVLFGQYTGQNRGQSPPDAAAFKQFVLGLDAEQLKSLTDKDVDSLFISPRDNQPYVIHYKAEMGVPGVGVPDAAGGGWLAHEQTGVEGKKYLLLSTGIIEEVDASRFDEIVR